MDRLALVESRLNPRTVSAVEIDIVEEHVPEVPAVPEVSVVPEASRYTAYFEMVPRISEEDEDEDEDEDEYEMEKIEKMYEKKTDEAKSMV